MVIVCSQSTILEAKIDALSSTPPSQSGRVGTPPSHDSSLLHLDEYDYEAVCSMMAYLYSTNYTALDQEPDFSLPHHIKVFCLAVQLSISGLEELSAAKFRYNLCSHVKDLEVYFSSIKEVYCHTTPDHPALRLVVIEAAVTEMRNLLQEHTRSRFLDVTSTVKDFQAEMFLFLMQHPSRPVAFEYVFPALCNECGPRDDGDGYELMMNCKKCGDKKTLEFY
jgi:hypothetical protein